MCGKPVTLPDNLRVGQKEFAVPAEPFKKLDVSWSGIRAGDMIAIPLPNIIAIPLANIGRGITCPHGSTLM